MQIPRRFPDWQVPFVIALVCVVAAAWGDAARELFRYDRLAIADGAIWRLLSGHVVHLGLQHLALNLAGLALVWFLVGRRYGTKQWIYVVAISVVTTGAGFWWLDSDLRWYVGLSGVLHGMLLAGAIQGLRWIPWESAVICVLIVAKLGYEQFVGPLPGSEIAAGGVVIVSAHLYGAAGGVLAAALFWRSPRPPASI
jgi:rhomboid family GlyGly-CTERM serine protease